MSFIGHRLDAEGKENDAPGNVGHVVSAVRDFVSQRMLEVDIKV